MRKKWIGALGGILASVILAAKKLGRGGRVIAFEPSPRERQRMQVHLRHNRTKTVALEPYALSAGEGGGLQPLRLSIDNQKSTIANCIYRLY